MKCRAGKIWSPCRHLRPKINFGNQIVGRGGTGQFGDQFFDQLRGSVWQLQSGAMIHNEQAMLSGVRKRKTSSEKRRIHVENLKFEFKRRA